jgi:hypothetical protein
LGLAGDLGVEHGRSAAAAWPIEGFATLLAELFHAAFDAIGGDAKGANDVGLLAGPLTDQLGSEHAKGRLILFVVAENRLHAQEIRPLPLLADGAEKIIDLGGTIGDQRQ